MNSITSLPDNLMLLTNVSTVGRPDPSHRVAEGWVWVHKTNVMHSITIKMYNYYNTFVLLTISINLKHWCKWCTRNYSTGGGVWKPHTSVLCIGACRPGQIFRSKLIYWLLVVCLIPR